jgi:hypothetical protein
METVLDTSKKLYFSRYIIPEKEGREVHKFSEFIFFNPFNIIFLEQVGYIYRSDHSSTYDSSVTVVYTITESPGDSVIYFQESRPVIKNKEICVDLSKENIAVNLYMNLFIDFNYAYYINQKTKSRWNTKAHKDAINIGIKQITEKDYD